MARTLRVADVAQRELQAQADWLEERSALAATRLLARVGHALEVLTAGYVDGRKVILRDGREVRRWRVSPLVVFYVREGEMLTVLRFRHEAQRPIVRP